MKRLLFLLTFFFLTLPTQAAGTYSGYLHVLYGDDHVTNTETIIYTLSDGTNHFTLLDIEPETAHALHGQWVEVTGDLIQTRDGEPALRVQAVSGAQTRSTNMRWVTVLCRFGDSTGVTPYEPSWFETLMDSTEPHMNHYWQQVSGGLIDINNSIVVGWYNMPQPRAHYFINGSLNHKLIAEDCGATAEADVYFPDFYGINFFFNDKLDDLAWGGGLTLSFDSLTKSYGATWISPEYYLDQAVTAHEMGHGYGLPHSRSTTAVYGNYWDVMSGARGDCTPPDAVYRCVGMGTIAYHYDLLGWIPASQKAVVPVGTSTTLTLEKLNPLPNTSNHLMATVLTTGSIYYTVEARKFSGYDNYIPLEGVVIHQINPSRLQPAQIVDTNGGTLANDDAAVFTPGETFVDGPRNIRIEVLYEDATGYRVSIGNNIPVDAACANVTNPIVTGNTEMLERAIICANTNQNVSIINLSQNSVYPLNAALPAITSPVIINGNGASLENAASFRLLSVDSGGTLTVNRLKLHGGQNGAVLSNGTLRIANSLISGNIGGITNSGNLTVINSTMTGNSGAAIDNTGTLTIANSIIWGNETGITSITTPTLLNSLSEGGENPLFESPLNFTHAPTSGGDYHLLGGSPALNRGSQDYLSETFAGGDLNGDGDTADSLTTDLDGAARVQGSTVDMGAYESLAVLATPTTLNVAENGTTSYTLALSAAPLAAVNVTVTFDSAQVTLNGNNSGTLAFMLDASNWNTGQVVNVVPVDDYIAALSENTVLTHTASSTNLRYNGLGVDMVTVNITENDTVGVAISETALTLTEGASGTYTVTLTSQPSDEVTVNVTVPAGDVSADKTMLAFTSATWNVPQPVTLTANDDSERETAETVVITHSATSEDAAYNGLVAGTVNVTVNDNDTPGVAVSTTTAALTEGESTTYNVLLLSKPTAAVTITLNLPADLTADVTSLAFDAINWNAPQTVTVTAVDDSDAEGMEDATISHTASSTDIDYNMISAGSVVVTITDNDVLITELLLNPGFEERTDKPSQPDIWVGNGLFKDRLKCNTATKTFSRSGDCAFRFLGSAVENARLTQTMNNPVGLSEGVTLNTHLYYKTNNAKPKLKVKLKVFYSGVTLPEVTKKIINTTSTDYLLVELTQYAVKAGTVARVKFQFQNRATSGKIYIDDVSVNYTQ